MNRTSPARRRTRIALALAVVAALGAPAGCSAIVGTIKATDTVEKSLATTATQIEVEMFNGTIEIAPGPDGSVSAAVKRTGVGTDAASAAADAQKIEVTLTAEGDKVVLRATYTPDPSSPDSRGASAVVKVPAAAVLILRTSNGGITASGLTGTMVADTSNAGVSVAGGMEALRVRTSNGRIAVDGGGGLITLETSNGAIDVGATDATVQAETSNGKITFAGSLGSGTSRMRTSNAAIDVTLPADASFTVDAQTSNAKIATDFSISGGSASPDRVTGSVGSGGDADLLLETSNGDIRVSAGT